MAISTPQMLKFLILTAGLHVSIISAIAIMVGTGTPRPSVEALDKSSPAVEEKIFDLDLKTQNAKLGINFKLKCMVHALSTTFWTVDSRVPDGLKYKILPDSNLLIRNISQEDYGREYFCHAIIPGRNTVESMQIELMPPPRESKESRNPPTTSTKIFAVIGELKTLICSVHARPFPDFKWLLKNGTLLQNKTDFTIYSHEDVSNLTVFMRSSDNYGEFSCEAWNNLGKTEQRFEIVMPEKPTEIPFIYPKSIHQSKIVLGLIYDKSKNYSVYVQYKTDTELMWTGVHDSEDSNVPQESIEITNLFSNTTYLMRAAVQNAFVLGDYSDAIRITTDCDYALEKIEKESQSQQNPLHRKFKQIDFDFYGNAENFSHSIGNVTDAIKIVNSTTWTSKKYTKLGDKMIISTSIVEEVYDNPTMT